MYANEHKRDSYYDDDHRRLERSENCNSPEWYQHDNKRVPISKIFERSEIQNRNRHPSGNSDRRIRSRYVKRYRRTRRSHRSESSDRSIRRRYVKRYRRTRRSHRSESSDRSIRRRSVKRHRRTRRTKSHHRSESSDRSSRRSVKRNRHLRRTRRTKSRDKKYRNRKRSHSSSYRSCYRSVERSRRHRGRHCYRCSSRSSSSDRSGYCERCPTRRDRYRYIYDRGGSGGCGRCESRNNYLRCGVERHEMRKGNEVPWQTATLQTPNSTCQQMPSPISTQNDVYQNAYMPKNDCRHQYSHIHPNLDDYAYRVPAVHPSGMDSQLCPGPSSVDEDMLPSIEFISEMLKNDGTNFVDSTPHNAQRIDHSNVLETTENILHIEPVNNDVENAVGLMDCYSGGNDMIPLNDDVANADGDMEAHNIRDCSVKLQQLQHPSTLLNQGTKEEAKCKRSPQKDGEQMAGINETMAVPTSTIKNNNPDWHSLEDKIECKICTIKFANRYNLVRHYIDHHQNTEVFPCRVTPDIAELLRDPKTVHDSQRIQQRSKAIFKQQCYFCNTSMSKDKPAWITHMARHTGYYRDKCTRCSKKFLRHRSQYCVDNGYVVREPSQRQFERQFKSDDVLAYVCGLCNYVRFDKAEIKKHLNSQHDGDVENNFEEVIFLRFPNGKKQFETITQLNESQLHIKPPNNQEDDQQHVEAIIKNNNPDWHCLSLDKMCKICNYDMKQSSVCHYANVHPNSEVIPSRVAPDVGLFLRSLKYTAKCEISGRKYDHSMYKQFCYFCNRMKCFSKYVWINHMIRHTGYYKYQCVGCSKKVIQPSEHVCDDNRNIKKLQQHIFDGEKVIAYLCDICNFVRFDKSEIENHLRNEHNGNDMDDHEEIVFLSFPTDKKDVVKRGEKDVVKRDVNDEINAEDVIEGADNGNLTPRLMEEERVIAEASTVSLVDIVPETELSSTINENCHTSSPEPMGNWIDANGWDTCSSDFLE